MAQLSPRRRTRGITLLEEGWSARSVARELNVSHTAINKLRRKWEVEHSVDRQPGSGRGRKTTEDEDAALVAYVRANPFTDVRHAIEATHFSGCENTARARLKEQGLFNYNAPIKEVLTAEHRRRRMQFAEHYLQEGEHFWRNVVFSDEKTFQSTKSGKVKVYRPKNCRFDPQYVCERARSGGFSVHTWAWISYAGPGVIWRIEDNLTGLQYRSILSNVMLPSVTMLHPNFIFQHDNSSIHTSNIVREWIERNHINVLPWPAKSPDLNPIENVWAYLMTRLNEVYDDIPRNRHVLWDRIENVWDDIDLDYIQRLITSMPNRLQSVIDSNGGWTSY